MLRDVFYYGNKPNVHPLERHAKDLAEARALATTEHFWIVNEFCDYTDFDWDFDFEFLPDDQVWTGEHDNVWPSQHNKDSGTWLCAKESGGNIIYRQDVAELKRIESKTSNWVINFDVDEKLFDFSWHPDPTDPPYIYAWSCRYFPATHKPAIEYHVPGATDYKYMEKFVELKPNKNNYKILHEVDDNSFDWAWLPDPTHPPYIYVWGNQHYRAEEMPTIEYHVEGAVERKYIDNAWHAKLKSKPELFEIYEECKGMDYTWRPDPGAPPYIYAWGNQYNDPRDKASVVYRVEGATQYKYMEERLVRQPCMDNWHELIPIDKSRFDYSWEPNANDPPYIYVFGNQWNVAEIEPTVEYRVPGATEYKYVNDIIAYTLPDKSKFAILYDIIESEFDFSYRPNPKDPPYIYVFGNNKYKAEEMPTVLYTADNAIEFKYVSEIVATLKVDKSKWHITQAIDETKFDFTWVPHPDDPPYIYRWGNKYISNKYKPTIEYVVKGATEIKYMTDDVVVLPEFDRWYIPEKIDLDKFDFSWRPDPLEPDYIWEFGTQWQKNGGPRYVVPGATEIKTVEGITAIRLPDISKFNKLVEYDIDNFDYSWHPDNTEQPYIYIFGNQHHDARQMPTIEYRMPNAVSEKYITDTVATLAQSKTNWIIPEDIDATLFDFSWIPNPHDQPYIYEFNTQWQKNGGPVYVTPGASERKYMYSDKAKAKPTNKYWQLCDVKIKSFDYSWHPDNTEQPYIYVFGNEQYSAEIMPTIKYVVPGATELKYVNDVAAKTYADMTKWKYDDKIDLKKFNFNWLPDPGSPPYIYQFGTQWQKTGGPTYTVEGATEVKYIDSQVAVRLPDIKNYVIPDGLDISQFDFSWHPDDTEPAFIYEFGTQHQKTNGPRYVVEGATETKYVDVQHAIKLSDKTNWTIPSNIDVDSFDFSWHPDNTEEPYDYEFATVWNDVGGPIYHTHNATQKKYIKGIQAKTLVDTKNFKVKIRLEPDSFDFSWVPHPEAPPYIYVFGNQWNRAEKEPTVEYHVPGATEYKYVHDIIAKVAQDKSKFEILIPIVESEFDFSWRPDPYDDPFIYVFGNTQYPGEVMPTVRYVVENATEIKYVDDVKAKLATNMTHWVEKIPVDKSEFDFGWVPDPKAPPYIYVFGNQWNLASVEPTLEYVVPGATEYKYIEDIVATVLPNKNNYKILHPIVEESFDFSWRPNPKEQPYIYAFGNTQYPAEKMPTILYRVSGATDYKYDNSFVAQLAQNYDRFTEIIPVDRTSFDYSWVPDPHDEPYIYVFGNQWNVAEIEPTLEYHVKGATQRKYMPQTAHVLPDYNKWRELIKVRSDFDYSWRPDPTSPPYIYVFGNQWNSSEVEPTLEYHVKNATEKKYIHDITAEVVSDMTNWVIPEGINTDDFDFSWRPNPGSPPYIYQFGTLFDDNDGPIYKTKKNNGEIIKLQRVTKKHRSEFVEIPKYYIQTTLEDLIDEHTDKLFWALNKNINYSNFNFSWRPNIEQARFVHVFGSPEAKETQTYFVNSKLYKQGFTQYNFVTGDVKAESEYLADLFIQPDIFMIDRGNSEAKERFEKLQERFPNIQKTRYLNSWVDTIYRCLNRSTTQLAWILNSELDYSNFDFKYYPNPWQLKMVHVFGTQWSHWGTTYLLNKDTFPEDTKYIKIIEHLSNLNFVKNRTAKATNCLYDIYLIDHGNTETDKIKDILISKSTGKNVHIIPYKDSYLKTFRDILTKVRPNKENYIWICSSVCDYQNFDMTYICDPFAKENLHVFPSDKQKFGDTFLVDVNKLQSLIDDMNLLEDYDKINYNNHIRTKRLPAPVFVLDSDTNLDAIKADYDFPYAIFKTADNKDTNVNYDEPVCLWADHTKNIEILSTGGTILALPKEAKLYVDNELYDYPYITKTKRVVKSKPLDIVFLSNGESCAEENYQHLLKITKHLPNKVVRVDGVNGRVAAYHAAANASDTPWMFTVFAKLKIDEKFDFSWQPDRLQIPKHYIFTAKNPVNGLVYGHQAMIAYNKKLTLNNTGVGLDFTLDDPHESVELLSGVANFNTDPYSTWRTAFREVIKLKSDYADIAAERLNTWTTVANGPYSENCLQGANDAVEYYDSVHGDIEELKKSYEWAWLKDYYSKKYN